MPARRREAEVEAQALVLRQDDEIEVAHPVSRVVAVLARAGIGRAGGEVRVGEVVQEVEVFEGAIGAVEPIPLGLLGADTHVTVGV